MSLLRLTDVSLRAGEGRAERTLLSGVTLAVAGGELVALVGPSGAGKTTLLEVAAALRRPCGGAVELSGVDPWAARRGRSSPGRVAVAFQSPERMFFAPTVAEEVGYGLERLRLPAEVRAERVREAVRLVGLTDGYLARHPSTLSGGEQRLAALASILVTGPELILLDEPTAGLAPSWAARLLDLLRTLRDRGCGVVLATHDVDAVAPVADRVVALARGRVVADGPPGAVFASVEHLMRHGVPVPATAILGHRLRTAGLTDLSRLVDAGPGPGPAVPPGRVAGLEAAQDAADAPEPPGGTGWEPPRPRRAPPVGVAAGLVSGALLGVGFFLPAPLPVLAAAAAALVAAGMAWGLSPRRLARLLRPVLVLAGLAALLHLLTSGGGSPLIAAGPLSITTSGLEAAGRTFLRVGGPVLAGLVVVGGATPARVAREVSRILRSVPAGRRLANDAAVAVVLVARLASLIQSETVRIERAQRARGGDPAVGTVRRRASALISVLVPVLVNALERAERLALTLHLRGFRARGAPAAREAPLFRRADYPWLLAAAALFALLLATAAA